MPGTEKIKKESPDEPDSDSEDELTEDENQSDASSTEMQEESSGSAGRLRPKPAYLSSNPRNQSLLAVTSNSWSQGQKIRYSHAAKSIFCNTVMLLCTLLSSLTWNFVCLLLHTFNILRALLLPSYLVTYMTQLFVLLGGKAAKMLGSLRLESRGRLPSVLGRKLEQSQAETATSGGE